MKQVKAEYECNCEVPVPEGNYKGAWSNGTQITFQVTVEGQPQPCQINASETKADHPVMVVVLGPYIYVYKQTDLK